MSRLNQLLLALKAAIESSDAIEFERVIAAIHCFPEAERGVVVQLVDALTEMYPLTNWEDDIAEVEPQPQWILEQLPTRHKIELEQGLYRQLQLHFRARSLQRISEKEIEFLMDELLNRLLRDFLQVQAFEAEYLYSGTSQVE